MASSLLPERPLLISPTLASTIGLEEAVMLQELAHIITQRATRIHDNRRWLELSDQQLMDAFPFWALVDIKRVQASLQTPGLLLIDPATNSQQSYFFAIDEASGGTPTAAPRQPEAAPRTAAHSAAPGVATLIPPNWQPEPDWVQMCLQQNIPEEFVHKLVPEFVKYRRDRGEASFSWGNVFYKYAIREWRNEQSRKGSWERASTMSAAWRPSEDAMGILVNAGINSSFIEDAIPEFVLYWRERGVVRDAWNTKFIEHIRRQWAKFSASFGYDNTPRVIPPDWQPSAECYEILQLAEIDEKYARGKIPEFVMYWRDSQQVKSSWNTVFLQFIKQDWARQLKQLESADITHAENQTLVGTSQQRINEKFQRIADRSWAE